MCTLNQSLAKLFHAGRISYETCLEVSPDAADLRRCLERRFPNRRTPE